MTPPNHHTIPSAMPRFPATMPRGRIAAPLVPALLLGWVACGEPSDAEDAPGAGVLHPAHHPLDATDSEAEATEDHESEAGSDDNGDADTDERQAAPDASSAEYGPGFLEPEDVGAGVFLEPEPSLPPAGSDGVWLEDVPLIEDGLAPDEETRALLLRALEPVFSAYRDEARVAGATFRLTVRWNSTVGGAQAATKPGRIWEIIVEGGLARVPIDRITHVGCHEMGHLLGGFPFLAGLEISGSAGRPRTAEDHAAIGTSEAAEGQADYFATKECLPRAWGDDDNSPYEALVAPEFKLRCDAVYTDVAERQLCYRILVSSLDKMQTTPASSFYTSDECDAYGLWTTEPGCEELVEPTATARPQTVEPKILIGGYPTRMCRLETSVRGALCPIKVPPASLTGQYIVPGDVETPWGFGVVAEESRSAAEPYACQGDHPGARPDCWYNENVPLPGCEGTGLAPHESVCVDGAQRDCGTPLRADERGPNECRRGCDAEGISCVPPSTE